MALIASVNRVLPDPMLLHIVSSFHGDFRVEVEVLSLKRDWLAQDDQRVWQHRDAAEAIIVPCFHLAVRAVHEGVLAQMEAERRRQNATEVGEFAGSDDVDLVGRFDVAA